MRIVAGQFRFMHQRPLRLLDRVIEHLVEQVELALRGRSVRSPVAVISGRVVLDAARMLFDERRKAQHVHKNEGLFLVFVALHR